MHFMAFALKRAYLRSLALVRPWLAPSPITPARFDLLHTIHEHPGRAPSQRGLTRAVGLSRATVSRALKRLEQLGIVLRERSPVDRRTNIVRFTVPGLREFRRVLYDVLCPGHLHLAYECAIGPSSLQTFECLDDAFMTIVLIAKFFGDIATLRYPSDHPDD
jgi:DNA-binding MarR family transcriptional regulator